MRFVLVDRISISVSNFPKFVSDLVLIGTRTQIQKLTETMQNLLQVKPVGEGQQEDESGGAAKNDSSCCTGKRSQQEVAACTGQGATAATEGGGQSCQDNRASGGSRPAHDSGRGAEVPAGVGSITRVERRGRARDSYLVGAAANGGGSVCDLKHGLPGWFRQPLREERETLHIQALNPSKSHVVWRLWPFYRGGNACGSGKGLTQVEVKALENSFLMAETREMRQVWNDIDETGA